MLISLKKDDILEVSLAARNKDFLYTFFNRKKIDIKKFEEDFMLFKIIPPV